MDLGGICASGKTPHFFVDEGVKINQKVYQRDILETAVLPWARKHYGNVNWNCQQDSAPAQDHKDTRVVQGAISGHDIICKMAPLLANSQSYGFKCMVHFGVESLHKITQKLNSLKL